MSSSGEGQTLGNECQPRRLVSARPLARESPSSRLRSVDQNVVRVPDLSGTGQWMLVGAEGGGLQGLGPRDIGVLASVQEALLPN